MSVEHRRFTATVGKKQISDALVNCVNDGEYTPEEVVEITNKLILYLHRNHPNKLMSVWQYLKPKFERFLNSERFNSWR
jgi:hypothetical protein